MTFLFLSRLDIFHENVPNCNDVADATSQNEEMEHGMHVFLLVDTVEYGARNVADAFGNNPPDCGGGYGVYQRFKGNQYRQSHTYKADGLQVAVILESGKTHDGSGNGASPDKDKKTPSPISLVAHRNERNWRVRTGNMPVDGGMVPFAQPLLPFAPGRNGMVNR